MAKDKDTEPVKLRSFTNGTPEQIEEFRLGLALNLGPQLGVIAELLADAADKDRNEVTIGCAELQNLFLYAATDLSLTTPESARTEVPIRISLDLPNMESIMLKIGDTRAGLDPEGAQHMAEQLIRLAKIAATNLGLGESGKPS